MFSTNKQHHGHRRRVGFNNTVTRMYCKSSNWRQILLKDVTAPCTCATSFNYLKTVSGQEMGTFKEACIRQRLLGNDSELQEALTQAAAHQMSRQLLAMLALMCVFKQPLNALQLWNKYKVFTEDLLLCRDYITAENIALHLLNAIFPENGMSCTMFGLPEPVRDLPRPEKAVETFNMNVNLLNIEQRQILNTVVAAAFSVERAEETENRLLYVDAPGGSGKKKKLFAKYDLRVPKCQ